MDAELSAANQFEYFVESEFTCVGSFVRDPRIESQAYYSEKERAKHLVVIFVEGTIDEDISLRGFSHAIDLLGVIHAGAAAFRV